MRPSLPPQLSAPRSKSSLPGTANACSPSSTPHPLCQGTSSVHGNTPRRRARFSTMPRTTCARGSPPTTRLPQRQRQPRPRPRPRPWPPPPATTTLLCWAILTPPWCQWAKKTSCPASQQRCRRQSSRQGNSHRRRRRWQRVRERRACKRRRRLRRFRRPRAGRLISDVRDVYFFFFFFFFSF